MALPSPREEPLMIICEFCLQYRQNGECGFGLKIPKSMRCHEFDPGMEKFCAKPSDFKSIDQIVQMATFFGIHGVEMKKIKRIAAREEDARLLVASLQPALPTQNE
jgi:hypothetical protein